MIGSQANRAPALRSRRVSENLTMPKRVAKVDQLYYCRPVKAGDTFDVDAGDVDVMLLLGRIEEERPTGGAASKAKRKED